MSLQDGIESPEVQPDDGSLAGLLSGRYLSDNGRWALEMRIEVRPPEPAADDVAATDEPSGDGSVGAAVIASGDAPSVAQVSGPVKSTGYTITEEQLAAVIAATSTTTISADLRTDTPDGPLRCYVRSRYGDPVSGKAGGFTFAADWVDDLGATGMGWITISSAAAGAGSLADSEGLADIDVTLVLDSVLGRLGAGFRLDMKATRVSRALRSLGLEIEVEESLTLPTELEADGIKLTDVMRAHGLAVHRNGEQTIIPAPARGKWSGSDIFSLLTMLNDQLHRSAQTSLAGPAWELHLMLLSKTDRQGLLGVMFDLADRFPRQGAAVFVDEVKEQYNDDAHARRVLVTAVHELGHSLNLTHRFLRDVGRADSRSFMNYDWIYNSLTADPDKHAAKAERRDYWRDFPYLFDRDELEFLLHGPRTRVIPGGDPFGSARYWLTGDQALPITNELPGLQLWLTPPARGTVVGYGQPVFLEVSLRNIGEATYCVPRHALDIKAGMLDLLIQPRGRGSSYASGDRFAPMMLRCFAVAPEGRLALTPGASMHDNLNLSFGSAGSPFAEPGDYLVTPELTVYGSDQQTPLGVVRGSSLMITIQRPENAAEQRDAETIFQSDQGIVLALGGNGSLQQAAEELMEITARRMDERGDEPDSLVAATLRMQGLDANRDSNNQEQESQKLKLQQRALEMLTKSVSDQNADSLDPHTLAHTRMLASRLAADQAGNSVPAGTIAYVDLAFANGKSTSVRRPGRLLVRPPDGVDGATLKPEDVDGARLKTPIPGSGVAVMFNLPQPSEDQIAVSAVVNTSDGISQRVGVAHLDVLGDGDPASEAFGIATLDHAVPAWVTIAPWTMGKTDLQTATRAEIEQILTNNQNSLPETAHSKDPAPVPVANPVPPTPPIVAQPSGWGDVISIICDNVRWCSEGPPAPTGPRPTVPTCGCSSPASQPTGNPGDSPEPPSKPVGTQT